MAEEREPAAAAPVAPPVAPPPPPIPHAHLPPPPRFRALHKTLQTAAAGPPLLVLNPAHPTHPAAGLENAGAISRQCAREIFERFELAGARPESRDEGLPSVEQDIQIYTHSAVPGLTIVPSLLPPQTQRTLLRRLLTRDLASRAHKTNLDLHYKLPPSATLFDLAPGGTLQPLDPAVHKPLPVTRALNRKLRWMTLGGQYDWTKKEYPEKAPGDEVTFPADIKDLIHGLFPSTIPQAAIMNLYSPGDTLAPHRDVSESSSAGLVSLSIGCSAVFVIGIEGAPGDEMLALQLNSGDAVIMDGPARWAWHSVPKVIAGSCPEWLRQWPGEDLSPPAWHGWMQQKRMNLNVRQMWD